MRIAAAGLVAFGVLAVAGASGASPARGEPHAAVDTDWTVYHGSAAGSGDAPNGLALSSIKAKWTSPALDGELYAEPLVFNNRVFAATENDTVYALSTATGKVVWKATGNGSVYSPGPYDYSDGVLELSPTMKIEQYFAPATWYSDNSSDFDLGSSSPVLLPNGLVVQGGKSQKIYLTSASKLGGIGGALEHLSNVCGSDIDGGHAISGDTAYLPCENGVMAVATHAPTGKVNVLWQTSTGAGGPPIIAGGLVWTISGGTLFGLAQKTGAAVEQESISGAATDFPTPAYGDGLLLAPGSNQIFAFAQS